MFLAACGANHSGQEDSLSVSSLGTVSAQSLEAFSTTVYAFGQSQGCVNCHANRVNPQWMNVNVSTAYAFARPLVDFTNPLTSTYATYAGNNHCNNPVCANPSNMTVMQGLLAQWAEVEMQQGFSSPPSEGGSTLATPTFVTATLPIPNPLPDLTAVTPAVIRFDLSQLTPPIPALNGAILEISIRSYNSLQNQYKVFSPRISGNTSLVNVSGIHVYVRPASGSGLGIEDANQGVLWSGVNTTAAIYALPVPLPVGPITGATPMTTLSLGIQSQSAADVITVGFAGLSTN